LGLSGIGELNPARQHFFANDVRFYPLWEQCAKLNMPILFHGGMAAAGAGTPGGMGIKLKYSQPIAIDDVAADFPELKIISAHPTWPWTAESLAIARHKANYYIDLSGWAPKYPAPGQSDVRLRLAGHRRRALAGRIPAGQHETGSAQKDHARQRRQVFRPRTLTNGGSNHEAHEGHEGFGYFYS
jgi:predicted TIM-barrel fold metal-dependent hydrolase